MKEGSLGFKLTKVKSQFEIDDKSRTRLGNLQRRL